jgi:hypothetical protein
MEATLKLSGLAIKVATDAGNIVSEGEVVRFQHSLKLERATVQVRRSKVKFDVEDIEVLVPWVYDIAKGLAVSNVAAGYLLD